MFFAAFLKKFEKNKKIKISYCSWIFSELLINKHIFFLLVPTKVFANEQIFYLFKICFKLKFHSFYEKIELNNLISINHYLFIYFSLFLRKL